MSLWWLIAACGTAVVEPEMPVPAVEPVVVSAPEVEPVPASPGGVRVLHQRLQKGDRPVPKHVSATWVADGLQVMITGLDGSCAPAPDFAAIVVGDKIRLMEAVVPAEDATCKGSHTVMLQLDGQLARDVSVDVVRHDGEAFGSTEVGATEH